MVKSGKFIALRLIGYYFLIAVPWIAFTDRLLFAVVKDVTLLSRLQTFKGWFFVVATGLILFAVLHSAFRFRLQTEQQLIEANEKLTTLIQASPLAIMTLDIEAHVTSWNPAAETMFGWTEKEVLGCMNPIVPADSLLEFRKMHRLVLSGKPIYSSEVVRKRKDGTQIDVSLSMSVICSGKDGTIRGSVSLIADITEQKLKDAQLRYLSFHDSQTGIYNRAYFEQEMHRMEAGRHSRVGLIVCDLDGLKLYNDSLGHTIGDKLLIAAAEIIRSCFRESDVVARIGGDEFAILLPDSDLSAVESACRRIREAIVKYNRENPEIYLSLSIGFATSEDSVVKMMELFREADDNMYREKIHRNQSVRSTTIQVLMKALGLRDFIAGGHTERMEDMMEVLATKLGLPQNSISDIRLFARYHDIGKVAIPESIFLKNGPLTPKEMTEVLRHSEIGHRIALSIPELSHLADWILKHHEWWDGSGYPLGLKESEIPLECRLLAIADAYDALTSPRPYRASGAMEEAVIELRHGAGRQFDPCLLEAFIEMIREKNNSHKLPVQM